MGPSWTTRSGPPVDAAGARGCGSCAWRRRSGRRRWCRRWAGLCGGPDVVHVGEVGDAFGFEQAAGFGDVDVDAVAGLHHDEIAEALAAIEILTGADGDGRFAADVGHAGGVVGGTGSSIHMGWDGFDGLGEVDGVAGVVVPMEVDGEFAVGASLPRTTSMRRTISRMSLRLRFRR